MSKNGVLYGAIQSGAHSFYALRPNKPEELTSKSLFTHLWLLENAEWKLSRGLSDDHQPPPASKKNNRLSYTIPNESVLVLPIFSGCFFQ